MPGRPVDGRERPGRQPERSTTRTLTDQTRIAAIVVDDGDSVLVDLDDHRMRWLLIDLGLAPTVPVPCSGCCRCYGTPIGAECQP
jgi:hypothetical protein